MTADYSQSSTGPGLSRGGSRGGSRGCKPSFLARRVVQGWRHRHPQRGHAPEEGAQPTPRLLMQSAPRPPSATLRSQLGRIISAASRPHLGRIVAAPLPPLQVCNHPYLFEGAEPGPPFVEGWAAHTSETHPPLASCACPPRHTPLAKRSAVRKASRRGGSRRSRASAGSPRECRAPWPWS